MKKLLLSLSLRLGIVYYGGITFKALSLPWFTVVYNRHAHHWVDRVFIAKA